MGCPSVSFIGRIFVLTVHPISGIKQVKFVDIDCVRKFYNLSVRNNIIVS